jgi:hypothetical protein
VAVGNNDILRITASFDYDGDQIQNVYHMQVTTTSGDVDNATFLAELDDDIDSMYDDIVSEIFTDVDFDYIEVYNLTADEFVGRVSWPSKTSGSGTGDPLPPQTAPLVLFPTAVLRSVGKKFLPLYAESANDAAGTPSSAALVNLASWAADVLATKTGTGWSGVMGNWNPTLLRFAEWTSSVVQDFWATQRRRYKGSGS